MSYQHDHLAWQQRCGQENSRRNKFEIDFLQDRIQPITQSKFNPKHLHSSYTNYFGNLMTLDDKRGVIDDEFDPNEDPETVFTNPYMLKSSALKEFRTSLQSNGNYAFGGGTNIATAKGGRMSKSVYGRVAARPVSAQVPRSAFASMAANAASKEIERKLGFFPHQAAKGKKKGKGATGLGDGPSIYDLVTQKVDVPEGLLYRGKYCGKSKLRQKMHEFGDGASTASKSRTAVRNQKIAEAHELLNSVQPRTIQQKSRKVLAKSSSKPDHIVAHQQLDAENRLRAMKKFYPEDYFRRSGYTFQAYVPTRSQKELVRLRRGQPQNQARFQTDFERFNEQLVFPQTQQAYSSKGRDELSNKQLDKLSKTSSRVQSALSLSKKSMSHLSRKSRSRMSAGQRSVNLVSRTSNPVLASVDGPLTNSPAEILLKIHAGKFKKMAARKASSSGQYLHPFAVLFLKSIASNEGSCERQGGNEGHQTQAMNVLEHFDEQCFLYLDEPVGKFHDAEGYSIMPLTINTIEDLEIETPELLAVNLKATDVEKPPSVAPSRLDSAIQIAKNWRPKSSKGYGSRNDMPLKTTEPKESQAITIEETRMNTEADTPESEVKSRATTATASKSKVTRASKASYISNLEGQLEDERNQRKQLQDEIAQIKQMNKEISEKLDINTTTIEPAQTQ